MIVVERVIAHELAVRARSNAQCPGGIASEIALLRNAVLHAPCTRVGEGVTAARLSVSFGCFENLDGRPLIAKVNVAKRKIRAVFRWSARHPVLCLRIVHSTYGRIISVLALFCGSCLRRRVLAHLILHRLRAGRASYD
jgi:hypothetical protein